MNEMKEQIDLKVRVAKRLYYKSDSSFGVFSFVPLTNEKKVKLNEWKNFVVTGSCPELFEDQEYEIVIEESAHPKYGDGYSFVLVKHKELNSAEEQLEYIKIMLKESQYNAIKSRYPDEKVIDLIKEDKFDWKNIKGFGEKTYEKVKKYLLQNLDIQEALVELKELKLTFKAMKKLVLHYGSANVVVEKIRENIYNLLVVDGFGFLKVDQYAMARGDSKTNENRINAAIEYILEQEEQSGHTWITRDAMITKAVELLQIEQDYIIKQLNKNNPDLYVTEDIVALRKNYNYEKGIAYHLYELLNADSHIKVSRVDERINEMETEQGFQFTDEQREVIHMAVNNNVIIINGKGGVGKTFTLKGILRVLNEYNHVACALSGKAAKVMANQDLNAMTIHRMLKVDPATGKFTYNRGKKLPYDIIVMDEMSMNNVYLCYSVISAVKKGAKIIIQGDAGQLASIGAGSVFYDLLKANVFPQKELTQVHRQAALSGILSAANLIREGKQINGRNNYDKQVYGELKDFYLFPMQNKEHIKEMVIDICKKYKGKDPYEFQVLTALKQRGDISTKELNNELQMVFNSCKGTSVKRNGYTYYKNDKVIQNGNTYDVGVNGDVNIYNGTIGVIQYITEDSFNDKIYVGIKFDGIDEIIEFEPSDMDNIELAYAITVHKSQGSTIKHVIFVFDYSAYMLLSKEFVYTGITRSSKGCVMICENRALTHAIRTTHSGTRNTFLPNILAETNNIK